MAALALMVLVTDVGALIQIVLTGLGLSFCTENCAPFVYTTTDALISAGDAIALLTAVVVTVMLLVSRARAALLCYLPHLAVTVALFAYWLSETHHGQTPITEAYLGFELPALIAVALAQTMRRSVG